MDPSQSDQVRTFMSITGASEEVATRIIQANRGDLNAAVNSFFGEGEDSVIPMQNQETSGNIDLMEVDEPPAVRHTLRQPTYPLPSAPSIGSAFRGFNTFPRGITSRGQPIVSQPRDVREVPIEWKDEPRRVTSQRGLVIEEIPDTEGVNLPSQSHTHFITDDEGVSGPAFPLDETERSRSSFDPSWTERVTRIDTVNAPSINENPAAANGEGGDLEQEMLRAAIEASQKDVMGMHSTEDQGGVHAEDDDLARAVSLSLKTAEREKALREGKDYAWLSDDEDFSSPEDGGHHDILKRKGSSSASNDYVLDHGVSTSAPSQSGRKTLSSSINHIPIITEDAEEDEEQPLFRKRSGRRLSPAIAGPSNTELLESRGQGTSLDDITQSKEPSLMRSNSHLNPNFEKPELHEEPIQAMSVAPVPLGSNGDSAHQDEWGVLTSEEQEEAVMLEATMFGTIPEDAARRFGYPSLINTVVEDNVLVEGGTHNYSRPIQQPPSPTVIAQRLLRERQDDEYLASLQADREKDENAQREAEKRRLEKEMAEALAIEAEKRKEEEELQQRLAEQEIEQQKAAKRAALPEEPPVDDDTAVNLMVRMPDGNRQVRRFRKSESLQCLFNFIDANTQVVPGSYRLVRQYPRKAFTDAEHENSLHDLGLNNNETLFLELI